MALIDYIEDDIKLWLRNENNKCTYSYTITEQFSSRKTVSIHKNNTQDFEEFRKMYTRVRVVSFLTNYKEDIFDYIFEAERCDIYFTGISKFQRYSYIPWITFLNNGHHLASYCENGRINTPIPTCPNIFELYSTIKHIIMPNMKSEHENDVEMYFATLPLFKGVSHIMEIPDPSCIFLDEIIIDI